MNHSSSSLQCLHALLIALACATPACGGAVEPAGSIEPQVVEGSSPTVPPSIARDDAPAPSSPEPTAIAPSPASSENPSVGWDDRCGQDGVTGIGVTVTGLTAYEGAAVYLSVVEPHRNGTSPAWSIPVFLRAEVRDGEARFSCTLGLHENYMYPSWALLIDQNGNGQCDASDRGYARAGYYGWAENFEVSATIGASLLNRPTSELEGRAQRDFCGYYFGTP